MVDLLLGPGLLFAYLGRKGRSMESRGGENVGGISRWAVELLSGIGMCLSEATISMEGIVDIVLGLSFGVTGVSEHSVDWKTSASWRSRSCAPLGRSSFVDSLLCAGPVMLWDGVVLSPVVWGEPSTEMELDIVPVFTFLRRL